MSTFSWPAVFAALGSGGGGGGGGQSIDLSGLDASSGATLGGLGMGLGGGFTPGYTSTSDQADWWQYVFGNVPFVGDILRIRSHQEARRKAEAAQRAANEANEARYQQILGLNTQAQGLAQGQLNETGQLLANNRGGALRAIADLGSGARRDIRSADTAQRGASNAALQQRGLGNTTLLGNANRAINQDTQRALADVRERTAGLTANVLQNDRLPDFMLARTGIETGLLKERSGAIERRNDVFNLQQLAQILASARGGGASGGGGGGGGFNPLGAIGSILGGI